MIFSPHIVVGAAIGAKTQNLGLIVILGLLTHFIMDRLPHWDYSWSGIKNFKKSKNLKALLSDFLKMAVDCTLGLLIVFLILWYKNFLNFNYLPFILVGIFVSILPDAIIGLACFLPGKFPRKYIDFNQKFFHCPKHIKKPTLVGLGTEILVIIIAGAILLL